jgi:hypothetical protein
MLKRIRHELGHHFPFTLVGGLSGIILFFLFRNIAQSSAMSAFHVLHPIHVFLSALVTASLYAQYKKCETNKRPPVLVLLFIGYIGAVGIATLSDSIMPYMGERILAMPHAEHHLGFIEQWWVVNPLAILGIVVAYYYPTTKIPHAGHVLLSTWASLFHILMAKGETLTVITYIVVYFFLVLSVWLPCCVSDIIFPLLFVKEHKCRFCGKER